MMHKLYLFVCILVVSALALEGCGALQRQPVAVTCPSRPARPSDAEDYAEGKDPEDKDVIIFFLRQPEAVVLRTYTDAFQRLGWQVAKERKQGVLLSYPEASSQASCVVNVGVRTTGDGRTRVLIFVIADEHGRNDTDM